MVILSIIAAQIYGQSHAQRICGIVEGLIATIDQDSGVYPGLDSLAVTELNCRWMGELFTLASSTDWGMRRERRSVDAQGI